LAVVLLFPACSLLVDVSSNRRLGTISTSDGGAQDATPIPANRETSTPDASSSDGGNVVTTEAGSTDAGCPLQNRLINGDFENGLDGWSNFANADTNSSGRTGKAAKLCGAANNPQYYIDSNFPGYLSGTRFGYVAWTKRENSNLSTKMVMQVESVANGDVGQKDIRPPSETTWTCFEQVIDAPGGLVDVSIVLGNGSSASCSLIDDIRVYELPAGEQLPAACGCAGQ
jgi:hypothetical protein